MPSTATNTIVRGRLDIVAATKRMPLSRASFTALYSSSGTVGRTTSGKIQRAATKERYQRGDLAEATAQLVLVLQIDPANVSARYELGNVYLAQRQLEQAAIQYREAVRLSPSFADAHNNLGVVLASLGQLGEAVDEFRIALRIDPSIASAQTNLQVARSAATVRRGRSK